MLECETGQSSTSSREAWQRTSSSLPYITTFLFNDNVHPMTMESMEMYCKRKHRNNEEKMLNAMISLYKGREDSPQQS
eukprot:scaffold103_cov193-Alexandrium_tamarense.AAC.6